MKPLIRSARPQHHDQRHQRHEGDAEHKGGPAGAGDADRVAGAVGAADAHGARPGSIPIGTMKADRGDLDGDGVRGERGGADQPHQQRRGVEDRHLEGEDAGNRQAEPQQRRGSAASRRARSGRTDGSAGTLARARRRPPARRTSGCSTAWWRGPSRQCPSPGKPRLPKIRHQLAKALKTTAMTTITSAQRGRSSAAMNERSTM